MPLQSANRGGVARWSSTLVGLTVFAKPVLAGQRSLLTSARRLAPAVVLMLGTLPCRKLGLQRPGCPHHRPQLNGAKFGLVGQSSSRQEMPGFGPDKKCSVRGHEGSDRRVRQGGPDGQVGRSGWVRRPARYAVVPNVLDEVTTA